MTNHIAPPHHVEASCRPCRGMGGFAHGEDGFDRCDRCAGAGVRTVLQCPAGLLGADCGEVLHRTARWDDSTVRSNYGCTNGHRYAVALAEGGWRWERIEDHAVIEALAS